MSEEVKFISPNNQNKQNNSNNNEEEIKKIKENRNIILATIIYLLIQFIFSGVIAFMLAGIYASSHSDIEYDELIKVLSTTENFTKIAEGYKNAYLVINCYTNFLSYAIVIIFLILLCKNIFVEHFIKLTERPKFYAIFIPVCAIALYLISMGIENVVALIIENIVKTTDPDNIDKYLNSENQSIIELMLNSENGWMIVIMTVLMAPVIEEFVYRYVIFRYTKRFHVALSYALSTILFTLPHMISTNISSVGVGIWLLQCIPYAASGILFSIVYHKSNFNIYSSIAAHMLNNLVAVIIIYASK